MNILLIIGVLGLCCVSYMIGKIHGAVESIDVARKIGLDIIKENESKKR
jgi:hypothetical protein